MSISDRDKQAIYARTLALTPGLGSRSIRQLARYFEDDTERVYRATAKELKALEGVTDNLIRVVKKAKTYHEQATFEYKQAKRYGLDMMAFSDTDFPHRLRVFDDAPVVLFTRGTPFPFYHRHSIGVVGTRNATSHGRSLTEQWIEQWAVYQPCIVSGLAYGIDIAAHQAAIKLNVPTVAVLGNGLDSVYPAVHRSIANRMLDNGGLISEFPPGTKPDRQNFPMRNRIVAMLSDALVVIEAAQKGGALITANMAFDYNKEVYAVPGKPGDIYSEGCNELIAANKAALLYDPHQLPKDLHWKDATHNKVRQAELFVELNTEEKLLIETLGRQRETPLEVLCSEMNERPSVLLSRLLEMELKGLVRSMPGNRFAALL
ncbi:MAG: DNA-processing protein DprA [Cryomorphaceae bacterium]|nr:DNA-processing protein DprA [Cryomorphaceae bacterium]